MLNYQLRCRVIFIVIGDYKFRNSWFQKLVIRWAGLPLFPKEDVELPASRSHNLFCNWSNTNFVIHDFANRDFVISKIGYSMSRLPLPSLPREDVELPASRSRNLFCNWRLPRNNSRASPVLLCLLAPLYLGKKQQSTFSYK